MKKRLLDTSKQADKFLDNLPGKQFKQVYTKIKNLTSNSQPNDSIKMTGSEDQYRVDIGEYRIIYTFDDEVLYIEVVGKRNGDEVYKINDRR
jgi:mRNA interferase RelE/StbE